MWKIIKKIFLIGLIIFALFGMGSIIKCEIYTHELREQLIHLDGGWAEEGTMKVLKYEDDYALVYWKCIYSGSTFVYRKINGKWEQNGPINGIWSKQGSADGFMWP